MSHDDLSNASMLELFRMEAQSQTAVLVKGLLTLERNPSAADALEACMRAAHSLKGAARIVNLESAVGVTHAMEDSFVAAQRGHKPLHKLMIEALLRGVDLLTRVADMTEQQLLIWSERSAGEVDAFRAALAAATQAEPQLSLTPPARHSSPTTAETQEADRYLRVTARNFNQLLGLSGESLVEARWLWPFCAALVRLKQQQSESIKALDTVRDLLPERSSPQLSAALVHARNKTLSCQQLLSKHIGELEQFERRQSSVARRLHDEALTCRMRPFSDGIQAFPRMVRDLAKSLGKRVRLAISGETTQVDRDVLEKLEAPLIHLLRNAVDHGIESPDTRIARGKAAQGVVSLQARHVSGMLQISVSDDGEGIDHERVRAAIVRRGLLEQEAVARLTDSELYNFLLLPGFTLKEQVTEISGRGVGLDAVQELARELRGSLRVSSQAGQGTTFQLILPLTVSLVRTLLVDIGGEPYAFPLAYVERTLHVAKSAIETLEGRQHTLDQGRRVGLVDARQLLGLSAPLAVENEQLCVLVLAHQDSVFGLVVDTFLGTRELVVQPLDPRLGKIKDVAAGALLEDGSPALVVDVLDLLHSIEKLTASGALAKVNRSQTGPAKRRKRVLVVDDSLTVRELERKILDGGGYEVEVAVDGLDGWNAVRTGDFQLVVTDVDMPRLDGVELTRLIRQDPQLRSLPVMIVSYKDRDEDRRRGLHAGADFYLAKSSFHSDNLLQAVIDLIGEPLP